MKRLRVVWAKEVVDNFRDRRTLLSALVFGPLFGPLMFVFMISVMLDRATSEVDEPFILPAHGIESAPELKRWLTAAGADIIPGPADAKAAVARGDLHLVLVVPADYGDKLRAGQPAPLELVIDNANSQGSADVRQARGLLEAYRQQLATMRLQARGLSPLLAYPIAVHEVDVSTAAGRALLVLGMMTYFILFSMLLGGLYLAIDTTAGERERGSLEPLLTLPVPTGQLISGKILATCTFMLASLAITVSGFSIGLGFVDLQALGMQANFGWKIALGVFVIMLPFTLFGAGMMTVVASFTRSYKEAQTWLTVVLLIPTIPILLAALYDLEAESRLMLIPSLSQHLLITSLMKGDALRADWLAASAISTLVAGLLLAWIATRLYRREAILG